MSTSSKVVTCGAVCLLFTMFSAMSLRTLVNGTTSSRGPAATACPVLGLRTPARGRARRRGRLPAVGQHADLGSDQDRGPLRHQDLLERALRRGWNLHVDLVGLDLDQRLLFTNAVAHRLEPLRHRALGHALSELGNDDRDGHEVTSSPR